jgi:hypothetical protein
MKVLKSHFAAASMNTSTKIENNVIKQMLVQIVNLNAEEILLFVFLIVLDVENVADQNEIIR